jgi:hypothetical protein
MLAAAGHVAPQQRMKAVRCVAAAELLHKTVALCHAVGEPPTASRTHLGELALMTGAYAQAP